MHQRVRVDSFTSTLSCLSYPCCHRTCSARARLRILRHTVRLYSARFIAIERCAGEHHERALNFVISTTLSTTHYHTFSFVGLAICTRDRKLWFVEDLLVPTNQCTIDVSLPSFHCWQYVTNGSIVSSKCGTGSHSDYFKNFPFQVVLCTTKQEIDGTCAK